MRSGGLERRFPVRLTLAFGALVLALVLGVVDLDCDEEVRHAFRDGSPGG